ncbi:bifunctional adenosylcobinamide kinase/adenosylcobinamide-phosphate guanylyltransferase [Xinfangfangia sp. CPCC 101601]|uniref:Bifunctional adenosylcobalamin biosynthesis protein n=1 Tax=Pseudogemmobacter lacusdianii TaxID=3069608 RepID=A0ABU0W052_9RHOB|nr:bifunctional adenosylcobinamide kinase/adenosylcobinamide-phosphate guanylyltransferase [Xinfangfangia sp. CPCC 101601]MDQ2067352.1 bifunctional adenosylcobinamide kinase/adenosylcobinamide-phosphate guanylyltransferase [Xinfangfangia sp. CPCC 101601]
MPPAPLILPHLTLITGGARSGKSTYAEVLAKGCGLKRRYIATAQAFDGEMEERIALHQAQRGTDWVTVEAPLDLGFALAQAQPDEVVLVDCLTLWLTNHLLADHELTTESARLIEALTACPARVICVTNEVGSGIVPLDALSRRFRDEQGRLNQRVAAAADLAVAVFAGLPLALKGHLP